MVCSRDCRGRGGFALIVVMSLMVFILLLLFSMTTLVQVELATTATFESKEKARQNALFGLVVALGELQKQLGRDQRVTASPLLLDKTLTNTSAVANWTGVWDVDETNADGTPNPNFGQHVGWLISGYDEAIYAGAVPGGVNAVNADGTVADPDSEVLLVGGGSVDPANTADYVSAPKVLIDDTGEYAYWIADEGRKARINLTSRQERNQAPFPGTTPNVQTRFDLSSPARKNASVLNGLESLQLEGNSDLAASIARSLSREDLVLSDPDYGGSSPWQDTLPGFFHDITTHSLALQTDTRKGGLKKDLNLLFELSDNDFAGTPYAGIPADSAFAQWPDLPPTDGNAYRDPATGDQVSYLFKEPVDRYGVEAYVRGPTWHFLRDFYRLYKDVRNNDSTPTLATRPFSPSATDFIERGGQRGYIWTMESDHGGDVAIKDSYVNTVVDIRNHTNEPVTRLTGHQVVPLLNRVIYVFSLYKDLDVDDYELKRFDVTNQTTGQVTGNRYEFVRTGAKTNALALVVEPIVCLWNPYNVAIEFDGGFKVHSLSFPFLISIARPVFAQQGVGAILPPVQESNYFEPQMSGILSAYGRMTHRNFSKLDLIIGDDTGSIRLEPGEVRYFSSAASEPIPLDTLPEVNTEEGTYRAPAIQLSPGLRKQGGVLIGRRNNNSGMFAFPNEGVLHQIELNAHDNSEWEINCFIWNKDRYYEDDSGGGNRRDFQHRTSVDAHTEFAYIPPGNVDSGGSLVETDTYLQRLFLQAFGPLDGLGGRGAVQDWLYHEPGIGDGPFPIIFRPSDFGDNDETRKIPFMFFGTYLNTVRPDPVVVDSTTEFIGTMSPFAANVDPQFSNFDILQPSFSVQLGHMSNYTEIQSLGDYGFFGEGYSSGSETHLVVGELPSYPLRSLASLQHAHIAPSSYLSGQAIGNSWASGLIDRDATTASSGRYTQYDISYLSNEALFDGYFFSSLTPEMQLFGDVREVADLETTLTGLVQDALNEGAPLRLSNERFTYVGDPAQLNTSGSSIPLVDELNAVDGFAKTASYFAVEGGFNVNSLSVDAWEALLASTLGTDYTYLDPTSGYETVANADLTVFPRTTLPNGDPGELWLGPRGLTGAERRALAAAIVEEVRTRGPFTSLAAFVNRELTIGDTGRKGAIQAAIDAIGINEDVEYDDAYLGAANAFREDNVTAKTGVGVPQYLTQADVLTPLAPYLSVRSDTFIIRAYGNALDPLTGELVSEAWVEALVQRVPAFVEAGADSPDTPLSLVTADNQAFGRQFKVLATRWLNQDEL